MAGTVLRRGWIALAGAVGGLYASALFLPGMEWLGAWPCKLACGVLMALIAFGGGKGLLRGTVMFFGASFLLAGLVLGAELMGSGVLTADNGVLYSDFDLRLMLVVFVLCYFLLSLFFRNLGRHGPSQTRRAEVSICGRRINFTALIDTGNTLSEPGTNRPVMVVEHQLVSRLLPVEVDPCRPVEGADLLHRAGVKGCQLLPYRTVGVECGLLLAVRAEQVRLDGKAQGAMMIALSPGAVSDGGNYHGLIGGV